MLDKEAILCGRCIQPPEMPENAAPTDDVNCTACGQKDKVSRVVSEARKYATHQAARAQDRIFVREGRTVRSFTPTKPPYKSLRWIAGVIDCAAGGEARPTSRLSR